MTTYHKVIQGTIAFALLGVLLSGYLSYWNLFGPSCHAGPLNWLVSCGGPRKVLIFGQPTCIYGFGMFLTVLILSFVALAKRPSKGLATALIALGIAGSLFSGGLTVYEIWVLKLTFTGLPACVYGLLFYVGILSTSIFAYRSLSHGDSTSPAV